MGVHVWGSHLLIMGTGTSEMRGSGRCVSRQVGTPFSHDHSMARLMNTHACRDIQKGQADRQTEGGMSPHTDRWMRWNDSVLTSRKRTALSRRYLGSYRRCGDVRGAVLVMVVVVRVSASPPVVLLVLLFLALGATFHGVCVGVRVAVRVAQRRGGGGQLLQGGVRGFHPNCCLAQQVDGMRQSGQNELETLLRDRRPIEKACQTKR